jgi:hypothetical protein
MKRFNAVFLVFLGFVISTTFAQGQFPLREVNRFLQSDGGSMRLLVCRYDGPVVLETKPFQEGKLVTPDSEWSSTIIYNPVPGDHDAVDLTIVFRLDKGKSVSSGVAVAFDFNQWNADNYLMIPASVYNGNRNKIVNRSYASGLGWRNHEIWQIYVPPGLFRTTMNCLLKLS